MSNSFEDKPATRGAEVPSGAPDVHGQDARIKRFTETCWWLGIVMILAGSMVVRVHRIELPLQRDQGEYAYAGQLILQGVPPYVQAYNMKLPGTYAGFALILAMFGESAVGVNLGLTLVNTATILLIGVLGRRLIDSWAGVGAAGVFAVMSLSRSVEGLFGNAEFFVLPPVLAGVWCLVGQERVTRFRWLAGGGFLLGLGFVMKQHGFVYVLFGAVALFVQSSWENWRGTRGLPARLAVFALATAAPYAMTCFVLLACGAFPKFWFWTVTYASHYVRVYTWSERQNQLFECLRLICTTLYPVLLLSAVGLVVAAWDKAARQRMAILLPFLFFSVLAVMPGMWFWHHYFLLVMPALALLAGLGLSVVARGAAHLWRRAGAAAPLLTLVVALGLVARNEWDYYFRWSDEWLTRRVFGMNPFLETPEIASFLRDNTPPDATVAVLGSEPQLAFEARRRLASSYIYVYALSEPHPFVKQMETEMIGQIEANRPEYLVFFSIPESWMRRPDSSGGLLEWLYRQRDENYRLVGLVDMPDPRTTIYAWGQDAQRLQPRGRSKIFIYQRRDALQPPKFPPSHSVQYK